MLHVTSLNLRKAAIDTVKSKVDLLIWQDFAFAIAGGIALVVFGRFLGRMFHLMWPVPMSGSLAAALPRAIVLLIILLRTKRFGMLTVAGIIEVSASLSVGFVGWWPMSLLVPLLSGVAGDLIWRNLKKLPSRKAGLILTGGSICGVRMLIALFFWTVLPRPISSTAPEYLTAILGSIIIANIILGMLAGLLVDKSIVAEKQ